MPEYLASRAITLEGEDYAIGDVVPMARLAPRLREQLLRQRRIEPHRITVRVSDDDDPPARGKRGRGRKGK